MRRNLPSIEDENSDNNEPSSEEDEDYSDAKEDINEFQENAADADVHTRLEVRDNLRSVSGSLDR